MEFRRVLFRSAKFIIWTTIPWTLPASLGVSLHPELKYDVCEIDGEQYVAAHDLLESLIDELDWDEPKIISSFKGQEADKIVSKHPFYDRDILTMLGTHVTTEAGTGCVHTAPGHGEEDFYISQEYGIEALCPVDEQGVFTNEAPEFESLFYDDANKLVSDKLTENNALLQLAFITHSYPHDWRTKKIGRAHV